MPIYEYESEDGTVVELMRPMAEADDPVPDPDGRGRTFRRRHSVFSAGAARPRGAPAPGGCCPCGKNQGACPNA